jgi:hypothetical protein
MYRIILLLITRNKYSWETFQKLQCQTFKRLTLVSQEREILI